MIYSYFHHCIPIFTNVYIYIEYTSVILRNNSKDEMDSKMRSFAYDTNVLDVDNHECFSEIVHCWRWYYILS